MRFYVNRDTNGLIQAFSYPEQINGAAGANSAAVKRGDTPALEWLFGRAYGSAEEIDADEAITTFKFGAKVQNDFPGDYVLSNWDSGSSTWLYSKSGGSTFADAVTTNTSTTLTSATAKFASADVGLVVIGSGIPASAYIVSVESATSCTLSAACTATANPVTITIQGRTPTYTVKPSFNTNELNDLLVDGTIKTTVADQAARFALAGLVLGDIVKQSDSTTYWVVIDAEATGTSAGWDVAPQKAYVDLDAEVEVKTASSTESSLTFTLRVLNDLNKGSEGVPTVAVPTLTVLLMNVDWSGFPTANPGGGRLWFNGGVPQIGA